MPTSRQDVEFKSSLIELLIPNNVLDEVINIINASNLSPDDIFDDKRLREWAEYNDYIDKHNEADMEEWAENNGWTKE